MAEKTEMQMAILGRLSCGWTAAKDQMSHPASIEIFLRVDPCYSRGDTGENGPGNRPCELCHFTDEDVLSE